MFPLQNLKIATLRPQRGQMFIATGFGIAMPLAQPVVNKKQNVVLAEFLPFEAKIVTKRDAAKLELLVIQAKWCNVSQEQTRLDGLLFDLLN